MSADGKILHAIRSMILSGVVILFVIVFFVAAIVVEWKDTKSIDPMIILLLVAGLFGFVVCFLSVRLLIRLRKDGDL